MKELLYTVLELEEWEKNIEYLPCEFCPTLLGDRSKAVCQIRTRSKITNKLFANDFACQECKEKFENEQIPKCKRCGRLRNKSDTDVITGKYVCRCIERKEDTLEKELPVLPHERETMTTFYERQISELREKERELSEEVDTHLEALEIAEDWHKKQKQELIDEIERLKREVEKLKKQTPQELVREIEELKTQLEQLTSQQVAQIEVKEPKKWPWRLKK